MIFMVFDICESDGPCIIESTETGTLTQFPQGGEASVQPPPPGAGNPQRPAKNKFWKTAKLHKPLGEFDTSLFVVDSPASFATTRALGPQPPFGFTNKISHTIRVIDKNTNKPVASGTWNVTVGVTAKGKLTWSFP